MKTWKLTTKKPDPETILVEADRLLVAKTGNLIFLRKDAEDEGWSVNHDDPFHQLDGFIVVRVQGAGTYTKCIIMEHNHDR